MGTGMEGNRLSEVRQITVWVMLWMVSMTLFSLVGFDASGLLPGETVGQLSLIHI